MLFFQPQSFLIFLRDMQKMRKYCIFQLFFWFFFRTKKTFYFMMRMFFQMKKFFKFQLNSFPIFTIKYMNFQKRKIFATQLCYVFILIFPFFFISHLCFHNIVYLKAFFFTFFSSLQAWVEFWMNEIKVNWMMMKRKTQINK